MSISNISKLNKQLVFSGVMVMVGLFGMVDTASASRVYKHDSRSDRFFESKRNQNASRHQHFDSDGHPYTHNHRTTRTYSAHGYRNDRRNHNHNYRHQNNRAYYGGGRRLDHNSYQTRIASNRHCVSYKVVARGGVAGFRFNHEVEKFKKINNRTLRGTMCGHTKLGFELSKLDPAVSVSIMIDGRRYRFPANSGFDSKTNNWYRKNFSIRVR